MSEEVKLKMELNDVLDNDVYVKSVYGLNIVIDDSFLLLVSKLRKVRADEHYDVRVTFLDRTITLTMQEFIERLGFSSDKLTPYNLRELEE